MQEHKKPQLQLTIRDDGIDLHTNGQAGPMAAFMLRALSEPMGAPPVYVVKETIPPPSPDDEVDLVEDLSEFIRTAPTYPRCASQILSHLRAKGLLRTPEDVRLAERLANAETTADDWSRRCKGAMELYEKTKDHLDKAQAQVREFTAKVEESAQRAEKAEATWRNMRDFERLWRQSELDRNTAVDNLENAQKSLEASKGSYARLFAAHDTMRGELAAAERRAHDAGQEAVRIGTELLDAKKALAMERESLKAAQLRIEALEKQQSAHLLAHEVQRG